MRRRHRLSRILAVVKWVWRVVRIPFLVLARLLVLPLDLAFLLFDLFFVNAKKTRLFEHDCRGVFGRGSRTCGPVRKYINGFLFKLICRDVRFSERHPVPICAAGEQTKIYFARGAFTFVLLCAIGAGAAWGIISFWPELSPGARTKADLEKLLAERVSAATTALAEQDYQEALSLFQDALRLDPNNTGLRYQAGLCLEQMGQPRKAVEYFAGAAQGENAHPQAVGKMALYYYSKGSIGLAGEYARQAVELGADDGPTLAIAADLDAWSGEVETAQSRLDAAIARAPDSDAVRLAQAHSLTLQGKLTEAGQVLDSIPDDTEMGIVAGVYRLALLYQQGQPDEALSQLEAVADRYANVAWPSLLLIDFQFVAGRRADALRRGSAVEEKFYDSPGVQLALAQILAKHGDYDDALSLALACTKELGLASRANVLLGNMYMQRGFNREAMNCARRALRSRPDDLSTLLLAGRAALAMGDTTEAIMRFGRAVEVMPRAARAYYWLARAHAADGQLPKALEHLANACALSPDSGRFRHEYGVALIAAGQKEAALEQLTQAAELLPNPYEAYTTLGLLAHENGQVDDARKYYLMAVDASPPQAVTASNNLAQMLLAEDRDLPVAIAMAYCAYANSVGPARGHTADTFAVALMKAGYAARAVNVAREAARAQPHDPGRQLRLGIAEAAAGNPELAAAAWARAIQLAPDSEAAQQARGLLQQSAVRGQGAQPPSAPPQE